MIDTLQLAEQLGWRLVPCHPGTHRPLHRGWLDQPPSPEAVAEALEADAERGVAALLGEPSGGLVDADLDSPIARALADRLLPPTDAVLGRDGAAGHRLYRAVPLPRSVTFADPEGRTLVELRSARRHLLLPPSRHPKGGVVAWRSAGPPAEVEGPALLRACGRLAAAALLANRWPAVGSRQLAALALGGLLARRGWSAAEAGAFVAAVAEAAADEEAAKRAAAAADSVAAHREGRPTTGVPQLGELLGAAVASRVARWLDLGAAPAEANAAPDLGAALVGTPYRLSSAGIERVRRVRADGTEDRVLICTFIARVSEQRVLDDGAERKRVYRIEGRLASGEPLPPIDVPETRFATLGWTGAWGLRVRVLPGQAEHAVDAIKVLSADAAERTCYAHTGWRRIGTKWIFLHAAGGLGPDGPEAGVETTLPTPLQRYWLPPPPAERDAGRRAVAAARRFAEIGDGAVTLPVLAAALAAPLAEVLGAGFMLWLLGPTGCWKTSLLCLVSHLYGGPFSAHDTPLGWESTANAIERLCYSAKDLPILVDDFRPPVTSREAIELEQRAQRVARAVGNGTGRARMDPTTALRPLLPPRCLPLSSGEALPSGSSTRARLLIVETARERIDRGRLTEAQREAPEWYPRAGALWVVALARELDTLAAELPRRRDALRAALFDEVLHPQHAAQAARLIVALSAWAELMVERGWADRVEMEELTARGVEAIRAVAARSGEHDAEERLAWRFLALVRAVLEQDRAHLVLLYRGEPGEYAERFALLGGRRGGLEPPPTPRIGWADLDAGLVYLLPTEALREVCEYARNLPRRFLAGEAELARDLAACQLLARTSEGRRTYRVAIGDTKPRVWAVRIADLLGDRAPAEGDDA